MPTVCLSGSASQPDKGGMGLRGQRFTWTLASSLSFSVANRTRPCRNTASAEEAQCQLENPVPVGAWYPVGSAFLGCRLSARTGPAARPSSCSVCPSSGRGVLAELCRHFQRPRGKSPIPLPLVLPLTWQLGRSVLVRGESTRMKLQESGAGTPHIPSCFLLLKLHYLWQYVYPEGRRSV